MRRNLILYALTLAVVSVLLKIVQYKFVIIDNSLEIYGLIIAVIFTTTGVWAGRKLTAKKPVEVIIEKTIYMPAFSQENFKPNDTILEKLNITKREYEILGLIAKGCSNQEIADKLFLSINTIKTHTANLFVKLDVSRRTHAIQKARELSLIP